MNESEPAVQREILLRAERDEVWRALTEPELLTRWLADEVELDPEEGGEVRARSRDGDERCGEVEHVVEGERLRWRWRGEDRVESEVEIVLVDAVAGTRLRVVERPLGLATLASAGAWDDRLLMLELVSLVAPRAQVSAYPGLEMVTA